MPDMNNLELKVTDFGPIAKADIDFRPLTVFVGPSNTGKSYLAILIYVLHRFFNGTALLPSSRVRRFVESAFYIHSAVNSKYIEDITRQDVDLLIQWGSQIREQIDQNELCTTIPSAIMNMLGPSLRLHGFGSDFGNEIQRSFSTANTQSLILRHLKTSSKIDIINNNAIQNLHALIPLTYRFTIESKNTMLESTISELTKLQIKHAASIYRHQEAILRRLSLFDYGASSAIKDTTGTFQDYLYKDRQQTADILLPIIAHVLGSAIVDPLDRQAYYLPAGRTGIMHARQVIVSSMIDRLSQAGFVPQIPVPLVSGVVSDFLGQLNDINETSLSHSSPRANISERFENNLLQGAIISEESGGGYPEFYYRPKGWKLKLPLLRSSSMVSELAPVILYLRHVVHSGDVLIIEEPEAHLHPAMQVEFIRLLAAAVKSGVRVILTTHSEWVLEELANLVRLSDLPESRREGVGDATDVALARDEVGVWLFRHKEASEGSEVKEIELDIDSGGFPTEYDDVAMGTYNKWARIGNLLEETRNGS